MKREERDEVELYCDGSCLGNPGPGGWAALLIFRQGDTLHERLISGGEAQTTNNRMELRAAIEGLNALKRPCRVHATTDSRYVMDGLEKWMPGWLKKGWKTAAGKPVKNQELWKALHEATGRHQIQWTWVKGHSGHPENERVDEAARLQAQRFSS